MHFSKGGGGGATITGKKNQLSNEAEIGDNLKKLNLKKLQSFISCFFADSTMSVKKTAMFCCDFLYFS